MRIIVAIIGIVLSSFELSYGQGNPNPDSSLDAFIQGEMNAERFPGVATIIIKGGEIIWVESYGFADVENGIEVEDTTVFLLASLSKVFTGTAAMQLEEMGVINLNDDINNYLPWNTDVPGFESDSITFRRLMTHVASIKDNGSVMDSYYDYPDPSISLSDCMHRYFNTTGTDYSAANNFYANAPETSYQYSNMGTALNGYAVQEAAQMPFDQFCEENIFTPLCMEKTSWFMADFDTNHVARPYRYSGGNYLPYPHYGFADYPDGQLRSTILDLGRFMAACLNGGSLNGNSILSPAAMNEMWTVQYPGIDSRQGLNWYQEELYHSNGSELLWGHNGGESGVSTDMYLDPNNDIGLCVLTNGEGDALSICDRLYEYALTLNSNSSSPIDCGVTASTVTMNKESFVIYPNPVMDRLNVKNAMGLPYELRALTGKIVQSGLVGNTGYLDVGELSPGYYILTLDGQFREKILKQ